MLILTEKQGLLTSENWSLAQNDRTKKTGLVPMACVYTIPTVTKPSAELLVTHMLPCPRLGTRGHLGKWPRCPAWGPSSGAGDPPHGSWAITSALPAPSSFWADGEAGSARAVSAWCSAWHLVGAQSVDIPSTPPTRECPGDASVLVSASFKP